MRSVTNPVWAIVLLVVWVGGGAVRGQGTAVGEWHSYSADLFGTKYAPLDQINGDNFSKLEMAWRWRSADSHLPYEQGSGLSEIQAEALFDRLELEQPGRWVTRPSIGRLSSTPLMADGVLYLVTPLYQAAAVDAGTGETLWVHNPRVYEEGSPPLPSPWNHRGAAYWAKGGEARIVWGTGD